MVNSNLFTLFNAYAGVFTNIDDIREDTYNNTYLDSANVDVLEDNFSPYVDFPKPPRLNTVTDGGEIYRAILRALYDAFLNGSTEESMDVGLTTVLSFLTIDETAGGILPETNNVFFDTFATQIQLAYPATSLSGTTALPSDITISPSGLTVTSYDPDTQIIQFSGSIPISGQSYVISYSRDHTPYIGTDWINFSDPDATSPLPTDLNTIVNTYRNPEFSYWWETFNRDGNGVQIIDGTLDESEQGLVWRLPEKYITYVDPYTSETTKSTINLYNLSGTVFDINSPNKDVNPDPEQVTTIFSYVDQVSRDPDDYYIRYSANNNLFTGLDEFIGGMTQVEQVSDLSVDFASDNFGTMDFFEKGDNFDETNLFGGGTKRIWTNVANENGQYSLSAEYFFDRPYSLHETILFKGFFESGEDSLNRFSGTSGSKKIAEAIGVPIDESEDCLQLFNGNASVYPVIPSGLVSSGNALTIDMFDTLSSGVSSTFDFQLVDKTNLVTGTEVNFRFVIPQSTFANATFVGVSGNVVNNSIPFKFVDTYFPNIDEANYTIDSSDGIKLVAGNENVLKSSFHMEASGASTIISDLDSLAETNEFELEITKGQSFTVTFSTVSQLPDVLNNYKVATWTLGWNTSNLYYSFTQYGAVLSGYPGPSPSYSSSGFGGTLGADLNPSNPTFKISWTKSGGLFIDGIKYGVFDSILVNNLGTVEENSVGQVGPNIYPFNRNSIQVDIVALTEIHHYSLGNSSRKQNYLAGDYTSPYYYQIAFDGHPIDNTAKNTINSPREYGWHRLATNLGSGLNNLTGSFDELDFADIALPYSGSYGFIGSVDDSRAITLNSNADSTDPEFSSFFDNFEMSYYTPTVTRPEYSYNEDITQDWQGSYLDQSAVLSNRTFRGTRSANFIFELIIKGLQDKFVFIIQDLALKLKPAHTLLDLNIQTDHTLNTTILISTYTNDPRNWETGNLLESVYVTEEVDTNDSEDLPGTITISGATI